MQFSNIWIGVTLFVLVSCKKKEDPQPTPAPTNSNPTPTVNYCPSGALMGAYCLIEATRSYSLTSGPMIKDSSIQAEFYQQALTNPPIYAGSVTLNSNILTLVPGTFTYVNTSPLSINISTLNWAATGSPSFAAFSYSYIPSYAVFSGYSSLPDTCYKSSGININLAGISNYSFCVVGPKAAIIYQTSCLNEKSLQGASGTVSFTPSELSCYPDNQQITIRVRIPNYRSVTINGKEHVFSSQVIYSKTAYLKP